MVICYKKLGKLLIDKDLKKTALIKLAGISQSSVTKMAKNQNVNTDILVRVCAALEYLLGDIVVLAPDHTHAAQATCSRYGSM